jgi:hypothetical protein
MLTIIFSAIAAVLLAILVNLASDELFAWLPALTRKILVAGSMRFRDEEMGQRALEEWEATIEDIPGRVIPLIHAVSYFLCVGQMEREWCAEVSLASVDERTSELETALSQLSRRLRRARENSGVTIAYISRVTRISTAALHALERGDLKGVPQGCYLFAYLKDLEQLLGPEVAGIKDEYNALFFKSGGLPLSPMPTWSERVDRFLCGIGGHRVVTRHVHSANDSAFHWCYRECEYCGEVSAMWSERCSGKKVLRKTDIDALPSATLTCEPTQAYWTNESLRPPFPFKTKRRN